MTARRRLIDEAARRARRQLDDAIRALRDARLAAGIRQVAVASAIGVAHQLVSTWERHRLVPDVLHLVRWGAAVGRYVRLTVYVAGSAIRDEGQVRLMERARAAIGGPWHWRTEVPVTAEPLDRRAFDAVLARGAVRIGLELITRLVDAQAQIRQANLKLEASGVNRMILVLAETRHNREAVRAAGRYLTETFPARSRSILAALRAGRLPAANGIIFV